MQISFSVFASLQKCKLIQFQDNAFKEVNTIFARTKKKLMLLYVL